MDPIVAKIVKAAAERHGWTPAQREAAEKAANEAPRAIYVGDRMLPVDLYGIMCAAAATA